MIITIYPNVYNQKKYNDICYRIFWYLNPYAEKIKRIYIMCNEQFYLDQFPKYFDWRIGLNKRNFKGKIENIIYRRQHQFEELIKQSDFILLTDINLLNQKPFL